MTFELFVPELNIKNIGRVIPTEIRSQLEMLLNNNYCRKLNFTKSVSDDQKSDLLPKYLTNGVPSTVCYVLKERDEIIGAVFAYDGWDEANSQYRPANLELGFITNDFDGFQSEIMDIVVQRFLKDQTKNGHGDMIAKHLQKNGYVDSGKLRDELSIKLGDDRTLKYHREVSEDIQVLIDYGFIARFNLEPPKDETIKDAVYHKTGNTILKLLPL